MFIADSQTHIWAENSPQRPWLAGAVPHCEPPLTADRRFAIETEVRDEKAFNIPVVNLSEGRKQYFASIHELDSSLRRNDNLVRPHSPFTPPFLATSPPPTRPP